MTQKPGTKKFNTLLREVIKKKNGKKAVRLTAWVDPPLPLPRSGQENVKISRQVVIFGVILPFYNGQNGPKFSPDRFFPVFFFDYFPNCIWLKF